LIFSFIDVAFAPALSQRLYVIGMDKRKIMADGNEYFCHFYIYIPCGSILFLYGDTVHAGSFYSNQHIHFNICNGNGSDDALI